MAAQPQESAPAVEGERQKKCHVVREHDPEECGDGPHHHRQQRDAAIPHHVRSLRQVHIGVKQGIQAVGQGEWIPAQEVHRRRGISGSSGPLHGRVAPRGERQRQRGQQVAAEGPQSSSRSWDAEAPQPRGEHAVRSLAGLGRHPRHLAAAGRYGHRPSPSAWPPRRKTRR